MSARATADLARQSTEALAADQLPAPPQGVRLRSGLPRVTTAASARSRRPAARRVAGWLAAQAFLAGVAVALLALTPLVWWLTRPRSPAPLWLASPGLLTAVGKQYGLSPEAAAVITARALGRARRSGVTVAEFEGLIFFLAALPAPEGTARGAGYQALLARYLELREAGCSHSTAKSLLLQVAGCGRGRTLGL